jgi:hypothetical protein
VGSVLHIELLSEMCLALSFPEPRVASSWISPSCDFLFRFFYPLLNVYNFRGRT